ncbi:MAG: sigma-70 family RNA polymerase sigma factor [Thermogutta sp.]
MDREIERRPDEEFVRLLASIQRKLFLFVFALVPNVIEAEEIVQNTSVIMWQKFGQFRKGENFLRWACGIARNEVLKYRDSATRREATFSNEFIELLAEATVPLMEGVDERRQALQRCLERLQPHHRHLLTERYQEGIPTHELAKKSGKSIEAVRRMLRRIRLALYECVQKQLTSSEWSFDAPKA